MKKFFVFLEWIGLLVIVIGLYLYEKTPEIQLGIISIIVGFIVLIMSFIIRKLFIEKKYK